MRAILTFIVIFLIVNACKTTTSQVMSGWDAVTYAKPIECEEFKSPEGTLNIEDVHFSNSKSIYFSARDHGGHTQIYLTSLDDLSSAEMIADKEIFNNRQRIVGIGRNQELYALKDREGKIIYFNAINRSIAPEAWSAEETKFVQKALFSSTNNVYFLQDENSSDGMIRPLLKFKGDSVRKFKLQGEEVDVVTFANKDYFLHQEENSILLTDSASLKSQVIYKSEYRSQLFFGFANEQGIYLGTVTGDSLAGEPVELRVSAFTITDLSKPLWSYVDEISDTEVANLKLFNCGSAKICLLSNQRIDRPSTLVFYELDSHNGKLLSKSTHGSFASSLRVADVYHNDKTQSLYAILRQKGEHFWKFQLCHLR